MGGERKEWWLVFPWNLTPRLVEKKKKKKKKKERLSFPWRAELSAIGVPISIKIEKNFPGKA